MARIDSKRQAMAEAALKIRSDIKAELAAVYEAQRKDESDARSKRERKKRADEDGDK